MSIKYSFLNTLNLFDMKNLIILIFCLMPVFNSCSYEEVAPEIKEKTLKYGVSFGMCVGPCNRELIYSNGTLNYKVITTASRGGGGDRTEKIYSETITNTDFTAVQNAISFESFVKLPEIYGCPDCADGGAEYIEMTQGGVTHKVTIEYGSENKDLSTILVKLRKQRESLDKKYLDF